MSRGFTSEHSGIDITVSAGSPVYASKSGPFLMTYTGRNNSSKQYSCSSRCNPNCGVWTGNNTCNWGYGNGVIIQHADGSISMYAHMNSVSVSNGQSVTQWQQIGYSGSTGNSTGAHLHFELASSYTKKGTYYEPNSFNNSPNSPDYGITSSNTTNLSTSYGYQYNPNGVQYIFSSVPPTIATLNVYRTRINIGETVNFTYSANQTCDFWLHVAIDKREIDVKSTSGGTISYTFNSIGRYVLWIGAVNGAGECGSNTVTVDVGTPDVPVLSVNASDSMHPSILKWNATTNTGFYNIRFYDTNGNRIYLRDDYLQTSFSALQPADQYQTEVCSVRRNLWVTKSARVNFTVTSASPSHTPELASTDCVDNKLYTCEGTWLEDKALAEAEGGRLAIVKSPAEQDCIYDMVSDFNEMIYIGAQGYSNYSWLWVDGSVVSGYTFWDDNKPDNYQGQENCMIMYPSNGSWDDYSCDNTSLHGYIAEFDAVDLTVDLIEPPWLHGTDRSRENLQLGVSFADETSILWTDGYELTSSETEDALTVTVTCAGLTASCEIPTRLPDPDFIIPADLTKIGEEAFTGINAEVVAIPAGCTYIGHRAFSGCPNLKYVIVPDLCDIEIEEDALEDSNAVFIEQ